MKNAGICFKNAKDIQLDAEVMNPIEKKEKGGEGGREKG